MTTLGYCRVSGKGQAEALASQVACVQKQYPEAEIIRDFGSGINFKRKGLISLLERVLRGDKLRVVVAHRDRLARFGSEVIQFLVEQNGGEVVVLDQNICS
ncbi:recombinase family protein, partial [Candidatus Poribacteria bacterium]|nr:recombinase family protein [Candidatus Poribacteria bacterium]